MLRYSIRSILTRPRTVVPAFFATTLAVFFVAALLHVVSSMARTIAGGGSPARAIVLSEGAPTTVASAIPIDAIPRLQVLPGVRKDGDTTLSSAELLVTAQARDERTGLLATFLVRGVDPVALRLHPEIRLGASALPRSGSNDALVGRLRKGLNGLVPGGTFRIGRARWAVTGEFSADGTSSESEVWVDRGALMASAQLRNVSVFVADLVDATAFPTFATAVAGLKEPRLIAIPEPMFKARRLSRLAPLISIAYGLVVVLAIGATFAGLAAMYASFLGRTKELATLLAIGYTRGRVAMILLVESVLISVAATGIGLAASASILGRQMPFPEALMVITIGPSSEGWILGVAIGLLIGGLSTLTAIWQTYRTRVLDALNAH